MNKCRIWKEEMVEAYYEELSAVRRKEFTRHLERCESCRREWKALQEELSLLDNPVAEEPGREFWESYTYRVLEKIKKEAHTDAPRTEKAGILTRFRDLFPPLPHWSLQAAAAVSVLVIGIFIGRQLGNHSGPAAPFVHEDNPQLRMTATQQRADSFLERSKLLLLGFVNFDPETEDIYTLNLPLQKKLSRKLVSESADLKELLDNPAQARLRSLVSDLEVILMQIANLESEQDLSAVAMVQSGVDTRGILFKINLEHMKKTTEDNNKHTNKHRSI